MPIPIFAEPSFSSQTQTKGHELWRTKRVRVLGVKPGAADLIVRGSIPYSVRIRGNANLKHLSVFCTCASFDEGQACKHIWASLLALGEQNTFDLPSTKGFEVVLSGGIPAIRGHQMPSTRAESEILWREEIARAQAPRPAKSETMNYGRTENNKVASFVLDLAHSIRQNKIQLRFAVQEYLKNGELGALKAADLNQDSLRFFPAPGDRHLLRAVLGRTELNASHSFYTHARGVPGVGVPADYAEDLLAEISAAGKLLLQKRKAYSFSKTPKLEAQPYRLDQGRWTLQPALEKSGKVFALTAELRSESATAPLDKILCVIDRFSFFDDFMAVADADKARPWYELFRKNSRLEIPEAEINQFLEMYLNDPSAPSLNLPPELEFSARAADPGKVRLIFSNFEDTPVYKAELAFMYGERQVYARDASTSFYDIPGKSKLTRNSEFENEARARFTSLGGRLPDPLVDEDKGADGVFLEPQFVTAAAEAVTLGWEVVVNQKALSFGSHFDMKVTSGVDWFDVKAEFDFQGAKISLPALLAQIRGGEKFIHLDDGSYGLMPAEWRDRFAAMARMGVATEQGIRLSKIQALFLSADLQENEKFAADKRFRSLQQIIGQLNGIEGEEPPPTFKGKLRNYQKEGLAWLRLISEHEIGGILADDMGLGKTVQLLALIGVKPSKDRLPHLIVAPKTLIFNWLQEAAKFAPHLRILNMTGALRSRNARDFSEYDVVITTYQTLRSDIEKLREFTFDTLILDEAHYAKNPKSQVAMACRLIHARRKFALTGTPVENSLNDLFSIMAIVNPGLLSDRQAQNWAKEKDPAAFSRLARALKPFILRRTKENVLQDLPAKTEQVLYCELSVGERKRYDELREYYWGQLSGKLAEKGLARSKIDVLEALLRLRQASCHQGLLDETLKDDVSTKFELLLEQLNSVIQDGRKALVFSQFTSLLKLLKVHLNAQNIPFEYLDGQTKDRQERVEKFQQEGGEAKVFLLSLKAGGVGLNLTAADYVFILDPWWNPAAEAQAIDRTHRIGQKNKVFAYKIIAKDTVEEKILALQESKKKLAKTVLSDEASVLKNLSVDDLRELFS